MARVFAGKPPSKRGSVIGRSSCHDRMTHIREVYHGNTCATEGFFIEAQKGSISAITFKQIEM